MPSHVLPKVPLHDSVGGPTAWRPADVTAITRQVVDEAPVIAAADIVRVAPDVDIWDAWPLQRCDGTLAVLPDGVVLWMALAAAVFPDPDERHGHARIHLIRRDAAGWHDLGPMLPDGFAPGSREWSGSALLGEDGVTVTLYFTAAGTRGEATCSFLQRMFMARGTLSLDGAAPAIADWRMLREIVAADPAVYMRTDVGGAPGTIKAFRDPGYFRDPADGRHYLFFAGSSAGAASPFNGVIGACVAPADDADDWRLLPPLLSAEEVNNELERPHVLYRDGLYHLFWSTQRHVFDPAGPTGPTGLYGAVADRIDGPWRMLNGTGLVFANPASAPKQAYSWLVLPDLSVTSFADECGADARAPRRFAGTFAPFVHLWLDGDRAGLRPAG